MFDNRKKWGFLEYNHKNQKVFSIMHKISCSNLALILLLMIELIIVPNDNYKIFLQKFSLTKIKKEQIPFKI